MKHTRILLLIALLGAGSVGLSSLHGATITVTTINDNGAGSLRQALADAVNGDTINFNASLNGQTIMLTNGELFVASNVTINGPGANMLAVDGNHASRVFYIGNHRNVTISGLTISNGSAPSPDFRGGGIYNDYNATLTLSSCTISGNSGYQGVGGGIFNHRGTLTVSGCTLSGNSCWYGGAISNNWLGGGGATVTITNSTLSGNSATTEGGGIYNGDGTVTLSNSTVSGNATEFAGGGIANDSLGTLAIINSTFSGNLASYGGGIFNYGTVTVTNSTLSGNSAGGYGNLYDGLGGGILNWSQATVTNTTLSGNSALRHGGGICNGDNYSDPILKIGDTILNAGPSGENMYNASGTTISLGYNLSSDNGGGYLTATGDRINTDPRLGPLQNNGGPTFTHLPASNSPAIDAGDPTLGGDQRGSDFVRVMNCRIDIGAVEAQATPTPTPVPTPTPTPRPHGHGRH